VGKIRERGGDVAWQVLAFFADHRVTADDGRSRLCEMMSLRRHGVPQPSPWRVRLAVRDLQPSRRPPPMSVPVQRTRRFRCVFDLGRCRRRLVPSSVVAASDSRRPSRLLTDIDERTDHSTVDLAATQTGPLIIVKHFCKVGFRPGASSTVHVAIICIM